MARTSSAVYSAHTLSTTFCFGARSSIMASIFATASAHSEKYVSGTTYPFSSATTSDGFDRRPRLVFSFRVGSFSVTTRRSMPTTLPARGTAFSRRTFSPASAAAAAAASARSHLPPSALPRKSAARVSRSCSTSGSATASISRSRQTRFPALEAASISRTRSLNPSHASFAASCAANAASASSAAAAMRAWLALYAACVAYTAPHAPRPSRRRQSIAIEWSSSRSEEATCAMPATMPATEPASCSSATLRSAVLGLPTAGAARYTRPSRFPREKKRPEPIVETVCATLPARHAETARKLPAHGGGGGAEEPDARTSSSSARAAKGRVRHMPFEGGGQGEPEATWSAAAFFVFGASSSVVWEQRWSAWKNDITSTGRGGRGGPPRASRATRRGHRARIARRRAFRRDERGDEKSTHCQGTRRPTGTFRPRTPWRRRGRARTG
mmetsp:Transcript_13402/g.56280  ORF Transcript_13402/g.56280 Transcript_13402/m.56280 type:complete len:442 (+) Transcript_13402:1348-2673(+)